MSPDLDHGGLIKSLKAGSVQIDYADAAPAETSISTIELLLARVLVPVLGNTTVAYPMTA